MIGCHLTFSKVSHYSIASLSVRNLEDKRYY